MEKIQNSISILITTFNRWALVADLVDDLTRSFSCPIIIVNDAGELAGEDVKQRLGSRANIINLPNNLGQAGAIDAGVREIVTSHMLYIDSDDKLELSAAEANLVSSLEATTIYFPSTVKLRSSLRSRSFESQPSTSDLRRHTIGSHSGFIISLSAYKIIGPYDQNLASHIDWDYIIRISQSGFNFETYDASLIYSTETDGISRNIRRVYKGRVQLWEKHPSVFPVLTRGIDYFRLLKYAIGNCAVEPFSASNGAGFIVFKFLHWLPRQTYLLLRCLQSHF